MRENTAKDIVPMTGYVRERDLLGIARGSGGQGHRGPLPFSHATLWRLVKNGEFPAPVKLSPGVTAWRVEDVRRWMGIECKITESIGNGAKPGQATRQANIADHGPVRNTKHISNVAVPSARGSTKIRVEAAAWREAENIRDYVANVLRSVTARGVVPSEEILAWVAEAMALANSLDPTGQRIAVPN